jgi:ATP-dependent Clp protease ATP-binding subunit ClpA
VLSFEKLCARHFTTEAIHIVEQLLPRAADRGWIPEVTEQTVPALALWSILRWERKVGMLALEQMGTGIDALARDVGQALDASCEEVQRSLEPPKLQTLPSGQRGYVFDFCPRLEPLFASAEHEAIGLGHNWVGSEHLLLATIQLADTKLRGVLERHGVTSVGVRRAVLDLLRSWSEEPSQPAEPRAAPDRF